jgi:hypothetical protein
MLRGRAVRTDLGNWETKRNIRDFFLRSRAAAESDSVRSAISKRQKLDIRSRLYM